MALNQNKVIRGTFGKLWVDGQLMANIKSFEAKASADYEDLNINGDFCTRKRYMGYSIEGTMVLHKVDSYVAARMENGMQNGNIPEITIVSALDDPTADGVERVTLYGVQFNELTLASWENRTVLEEEVPFTASSYKYDDKIAKES